LTGYRGVAFGVPVGVVHRNFRIALALRHKLERAHEPRLGDMLAARVQEHGGKLRIRARIGGVGVQHETAGRGNPLHGIAQHTRTRGERGDLLFFIDLPVYKILYLGMIDIENDHLRSAPCGSPALDGARRAIADAQETHEPGGAPAAGERLALAAYIGIICPRPGAVFEEPRLARPEIHDPVRADQIVFYGLNETGVRLRMGVRVRGETRLAIGIIDIVMPLRWPLYPIRPVQPGVEPLRRIGGAHLLRQHKRDLIVKRARVLFTVKAVKIAALPCPVCPGSRHAVYDLPDIVLVGKARLGRKRKHRRLIGRRTLQPIRNAVFGYALKPRGHARLAKIFLGDDVCRELRPKIGNENRLHGKNNFAVGIPDYRASLFKFHANPGRTSRLGEQS